MHEYEVFFSRMKKKIEFGACPPLFSPLRPSGSHSHRHTSETGRVYSTRWSWPIGRTSANAGQKKNGSFSLKFVRKSGE